MVVKHRPYIWARSLTSARVPGGILSQGIIASS